ncbi:MAG: hypothetical protein WCC87_06695 [Candidatus Korobacteraceae bacterium]
MLYKDKIKNLSAVYPELARVWIKTGDPRTPLKGVWIDESKLHRFASEPRTASNQSETAELTEDHLALAA